MSNITTPSSSKKKASIQKNEYDYERKPSVSLSDSLPEYDAEHSQPHAAGYRGSRFFVRGVIVVIVIAVAGVLGYSFSGKSLFQGAGPDQQFHAIFLSTGQVYFGTIRSETRDNLILDNVFYVQLVDQLIPAEIEGGAPRTVQQPQLIKKGEEFYQPNNTIRINRDQVLVVEDLSPDSDIVQQIQARL